MHLLSRIANALFIIFIVSVANQCFFFFNYQIDFAGLASVTCVIPWDIFVIKIDLVLCFFVSVLSLINRKVNSIVVNLKILCLYSIVCLDQTVVYPLNLSII